MKNTIKITAGLAIAGLMIALFASCGGGSASDAAPPSVPVSESRQLQIEDRIVSAFENSTTTIQYDFIKDINDGRGYTAGRAGFTSGTGDLLDVVKEYNALRPENILLRYQVPLEQVINTASTAGLDGLVQAWKDACKDKLFLTAQDNVNERLYRQPSRQLAAQSNATLPLTKLALYEAGIQHGYGSKYDTINQIVERASINAGGTPRTGIDEKKWLQAVLNERKKDLLAPENKATAAGWAASVSRADAIQKIFDGGNFNLDKPISITVYGDTFAI